MFSVYGFINLVCPKNGKYSGQVWMRLISEDSKFKDEIEFTMNGLLSYQIGNSTKRHGPTLCILRYWWNERKEHGTLLSKPLLDTRL